MADSRSGKRLPGQRGRSIKNYLTIPGQREIRWASTIADHGQNSQEYCFRYGPSPIVASGGFGASKTFAFCFKVLYLCSIFPRNRFVVSRRVWKELEKTTMASFYKICPPEAYQYGRRSDTDKICRLNNGSEILFLQLETEDDATILRGLEFNGFLFDQAEEIQEDMFDIALSRLGRWDQTIVPPEVIEAYGGIDLWPYKNADGIPIPPTYALLTCNPDIELHWIYRRFHPDSPEHSEKRPELDITTGNPTGRELSYKDRGYKMVFMSSLHNKYLPAQNKAALLANDISYVKRYVHGQWGIPEGTMHVVSALSKIPGTQEIIEWIRAHCLLYRVLDHGDSSPTCCAWCGVDKDGNLFVYREYYMPNKLISDHRQNIYSMSQNEISQYRANIADPAIFIKTMQKHGGRWSVSDEYADLKNIPIQETATAYKDLSAMAHANAIVWIPGDNNEMGTRDRINQYLRIDPNHIHPFTKQRGAPRLYFIMRTDEHQSGCNMIPRETASQRRVKVDSVGGKTVWSDERDENIPDHGYDTLRYMVAFHPPAPTVPVAQPPAKSFISIRKAHIDFVKRGGYRKREAEVRALRAAVRSRSRL